jgi:hypothetical protein
MWIILLDCSSSMGDPFSGEAEQDASPRRVRRVAAKTKWEAAKKSVLDEVGSLPTDQPICLIAFTSDASVVFEGKASQIEALHAALDGLTPHNGTDIAAALRTADDYAHRLGAPHISVEVISDGLSDLEEARGAAQALAGRAAFIEVILIDSTEEGRAVAKAITIRGRLTTVTSSAELDREVSDAARRHAAEAERVEFALARALSERKATVESVPRRERLSFTVGYPGRPFPSVWYPLSVYLHLQSLEEEVRTRLDRRSREVGQRFDSATSQVWANRGLWLNLVPRVEGVQFNPAAQEVAWYEDIQEVLFRFLAGEELEGKNLLGSLEIYASGVQIGQVPLSLRVRSARDGAEANKEQDDWCDPAGRMFEAAFASYSHADREVVEACAAVYKAMGIHMYIDRESLISGQEWHPALLKYIEEADVFQLYWSEASRKSTYVAEEWRHALKLRGRKGDLFVRPLYWQPPLPPAPEELSQLHFTFLDLKAVREGSPLSPYAPEASDSVGGEQPAGDGDGDSEELTSEAEIRRARSIPAAVVPLLVGETRQRLSAIRGDVAHAVAFLEGVTGLRYYPVPTLLVDEYTVRQVRRVREMVDEVPPSEDGNGSDAARKQVETWRDVLQSLLLEFHVAYVPPLKRVRAAYSTGEPGELPDRNVPGFSEEILKGIKEFAEWGMYRWTEGFLDAAKASPSGTAPLSRPALNLLDRFLADARRADLQDNMKTVSVTFSRPTSSDPSQFDERLAWEAIRSEPYLKDLRAAKEQRTFSPPVSDDDSWRYKVTGEVRQLANALEQARARLAELLPRYDARDYTRALGPGEEETLCIGLAVAVRQIAEEIYREIPGHNGIWGEWVDNVVLEALYPSWQRARDWLYVRDVSSMTSDLTFNGFMRAYLDVMNGLFEYGDRLAPGFEWEGKYSIPESAWREVEVTDADLRLSGERPTWGNGDKVCMSGPFADYVRLFRRCGERLFDALGQTELPHRVPLHIQRITAALIETAAYGIFAPGSVADVDARLAEWAVHNHVLPQATLPGTPRVLFCTDVLAASYSDTDTGRASQFLARCVLIHEHFHAILETGLGPDGLPPRGARARRAWGRASSLNESLAAWMELHYVRRHASALGTEEEVGAVQAAIWEYIRSGPFPQWPYGGAERVEALFQKGGVAAVRELICRLRENPEAAQREFEAA